jgi:hypothetical protein
MGVDYSIESKTNPQLFADPSDSDIFWAWRGINWRPVMNFLDVEFPLIYEPMNPYLSESDMERIRDNLKRLVDLDPDLLWDDARMTEAVSLRTDAAALLVHFNFYIQHKAHITRY